ncbi:MAG: hypothetical protein DRP89_04990, partial [Candidatus Neomarinimicrobiota bacterium]
RKTSPASPNIPPNTTLANIPVENDTLFALVTFHWDGEDDDGCIAEYEYRYITCHIFIGDSIVQPWTATYETSVIIPFESSDSLNYQRFQVRAVDNMGDVDPTPAERDFYTVQTIYPETGILIPHQNQQFFALEQTTDWWQGVQLTFTANDEDGEVVEYAWAVDNGDWNWGQDTTIMITPDYFEPLGGEHILRVTSRDNTNLVDIAGDSITLILVVPSFEKDILVIDETVESKFPVPLNSYYNDSDVDSFYAKIFGTEESWDFQKNGMPSKDTLGQYKLVVWHADNLCSFSSEDDMHKLPANIDDIIDYLNVGGDFIMGGWRILKSFAYAEPFPKTFQEGSFIHDYLHILKADETPLVPSDFVGAEGKGTFSDIRVDSTKLAWAFPFLGKLAQVNTMPGRAGFTDVIFRYICSENSQLGIYRSSAVGLRYYGTVFNAIVLGFPIFFIEEDDAAVMANEMLKSLGY